MRCDESKRGIEAKGTVAMRLGSHSYESGNPESL
jgi:hypothetical protein